MEIVFRVDASLQIGTGHVMRCLTLADALKARGAHCLFICRLHPGHLLTLIRARGFDVVGLSNPSDMPIDSGHTDKAPLNYAGWLGTDWAIDAEQTRLVLGDRVDWLIVDHYALDLHWEQKLLPMCHQLMVIDDLANRLHHCHLLLDQNLGRELGDYHGRVPPMCKVLVGPYYALLRPEFIACREYSLQRRKTPGLAHLLITMGGVDQSNATSMVLETLKNCPLPLDSQITVVMGPHAPWRENVRLLARQMPWPTEVQANVQNMAQLMASSDLSIGAAGSTSWERCCLGLPALVVVLADNQWLGARKLQEKHAVSIIGNICDISVQLPIEIFLLQQDQRLTCMSNAASIVTDGGGVKKILQIMEQF